MLEIFQKMERVLGTGSAFIKPTNVFCMNPSNCLRLFYHGNNCSQGKRPEILTSLFNSSIGPIREYAKCENDSETEPTYSKTIAKRPGSKKKLKDAFEIRQRKFQKEMERTLEERKILLKNARRKMQERGKIIMQDLKDTKNKMKEKIEGVIEVRDLCI